MSKKHSTFDITNDQICSIIERAEAGNYDQSLSLRQFLEQEWDKVEKIEEQKIKNGGVIVADKNGVIWGVGWNEFEAWADFVECKNDEYNDYPKYWGDSDIKAIPATYELIKRVWARGGNCGFVMKDNFACIKPTKSLMQPEQFRKALSELELTRAEFANLAFVNPDTVQRWFDGTRAVPGLVVAFIQMLHKQRLTSP